MTKKISMTKRTEKIIIVILIICILIVIRLLHGPFIKQIRDFELTQNNMAVDVTWTASKGSANWIFFKDDDSFPEIMRGKGGKKTIPVKRVPGEYTVSVLSFDGFGFPGYSKKKIKLIKLEQKVVLSQWMDEYVEGDKQTLKATAIADTHFASSSEKVAKVSEDGKLECKSPGSAVITITAPEGDYYKPAEVQKTIRVLPEKLKSPKITVKGKGAYAKIKCGTVEYADRFSLYKYDRVKRKYLKTSSVSAEKRSFVVPREANDYKVIAHRTVKGSVKKNDRTISSRKAARVNVPSPAENVRSFKSVKVIKAFSEGDFRKVAKIKAFGYAVTPQSFCMKGSDYFTAVISSGGSQSVLVRHDKNGKQKSVRSADIGFANGSTYNPLTKKIYTVRTHGDYKSKTCTVIGTSSGKKSSSFKLPRVTSGIAYDITNNKYYLSGGKKVIVANESFKKVKTIKKLRYRIAQDIGGHDGVVLVTVWDSGKYSHIDMYRESDKAYIGSYDFSVGEIESVNVYKKHLVILVNKTVFKGKPGSYILMTKKAVKLP